ncbi:hypothetical protein A3Q56_02135 [Intoshia linei]|uniref:Uncharacterized protein n=1 Tax=Intoshia linei TaxID=1819745 RepID=A0A177B788_9BILA|nr:hypothetical protein A3Q56_02135 [Intoshia linei]
MHICDIYNLKDYNSIVIIDAMTGYYATVSLYDLYVIPQYQLASFIIIPAKKIKISNAKIFIKTNMNNNIEIILNYIISKFNSNPNIISYDMINFLILFTVWKMTHLHTDLIFIVSWFLKYKCKKMFLQSYAILLIETLTRLFAFKHNNFSFIFENLVDFYLKMFENVQLENESTQNSISPISLPFKKTKMYNIIENEKFQYLGSNTDNIINNETNKSSLVNDEISYDVRAEKYFSNFEDQGEMEMDENYH